MILVDPEYQCVLGNHPWQKHTAGYWFYRTGNHEKGTLRTHYLHRVIYEMAHGFCPKIVDHINGDRSDNRLENLRPASKSLNNRNRASEGVRFRRGRKNGWVAYISHRNRQHYLGSHPTKEAAIAAHQNAKEVIIEFEALLSAG